MATIYKLTVFPYGTAAISVDGKWLFSFSEPNSNYVDLVFAPGVNQKIIPERIPGFLPDYEIKTDLVGYVKRNSLTYARIIMDDIEHIVVFDGANEELSIWAGNNDAVITNDRLPKPWSYRLVADAPGIPMAVFKYDKSDYNYYSTAISPDKSTYVYGRLRVDFKNLISIWSDPSTGEGKITDLGHLDFMDKVAKYRELYLNDPRDDSTYSHFSYVNKARSSPEALTSLWFSFKNGAKEELWLATKHGKCKNDDGDCPNYYQAVPNYEAQASGKLLRFEFIPEGETPPVGEKKYHITVTNKTSGRVQEFNAPITAKQLKCYWASGKITYKDLNND